MVLQNFEIIKTMIDIAKKDDLAFLSTSEISIEHFRDDSPCDSNSSNSTDSTGDNEYIAFFQFLTNLTNSLYESTA